jgi:hypothetical protein
MRERHVHGRVAAGRKCHDAHFVQIAALDDQERLAGFRLATRSKSSSLKPTEKFSGPECRMTECKSLTRDSSMFNSAVMRRSRPIVRRLVIRPIGRL